MHRWRDLLIYQGNLYLLHRTSGTTLRMKYKQTQIRAKLWFEHLSSKYFTSFFVKTSILISLLNATFINVKIIMILTNSNIIVTKIITIIISLFSFVIIIIIINITIFINTYTHHHCYYFYYNYYYCNYN